jgi:hypothetical protein
VRPDSRRPWLYRKLAAKRELGEPMPAREYVSGEGPLYLGRSYRRLVIDSDAAQVRPMRGRVELPRQTWTTPPGSWTAGTGRSARRGWSGGCGSERTRWAST